MPTNCNQATRRAEADRRRQLEGNTRFKDLGEPIQKLLLQVSKDITDGEIQMLTKITVRQIAKVFDMLALEEDPDKILKWLKRDAGLDREESDRQRRRVKCNEGAAKDAIAFYKELERKNLEMAEEMKKTAGERESARQSNIAARKKRREEAIARAAAEKERALAAGENVDAVDQLRKSDLNAIMGAFNRFNTTADNTGASQDTEWWKKDDYRRDFEKNGRKGKMWNRVIEGGSQQAIDAELASREEWYRSQCWWKGDKYKRDWLASRDAEWWKEESYIRDWQENGQKGAMWTAADEVSGFNKKGDRRPAADVELGRRVEWYKNNGPKGIVKQWCALAEGTFDRCTLEEKRERDDYYKNGDWWRSADLAAGAIDGSAAQGAVTFAGPAGADREWWKAEEYRRDFLRGGDAWKKLSEKAVLSGDAATAAEAEQQKREEWFQENWWKADKYARDFRQNGENGKLWRSRNEADTVNPKAKPCRDSEARQRAEWYRSAEDVDWWKDEEYVRDWVNNGGEGKLWTAAWADAAKAGSGPKGTAPQMAEREAWFKQNWWKQEKYVKDFQMNGKAGTMWRLAAGGAAKDADWWMQGEYVGKHAAKKKAEHCEFWKQPHIIDDYFNNGANGKMWQGVHAAAAAQGKGLEAKAPEEEVAQRQKWYEENWFLSSEAVRDFAAQGNSGNVWTATSHPSLTRPKHNGVFADPAAIAAREEKLKAEWWKAPAIKEDYAKHGANSTMFKAASLEAAVEGRGGDAEFQATPAEIQERQAYFDGGAKDGEWWEQDAFRREFQAGRDPAFWKNPEFIDDFLANGAAGKKWNAANAAAGAKGQGDKAPASREEQHEREQWFKKNFWKGSQAKRDFEANGANGTVWKTSEPNGAGAPVSETEQAKRTQFFQPTAAWQLAENPGEEVAKTISAGNTAPYVRAGADELAARRAALDKASAVTPGAAAMFEADAVAPALGTFADHDTLAQREDEYRKNWWKSKAVRDDFKARGAASPLLRAATIEAAALGSAADESLQATPAEIQERVAFFTSGADDGEWWTDDSFRKEYAANREPVFWKNSEFIDDFLANGDAGKKWTAADAASGSCGKGDVKPASAEELAERKQWLQANFWKAPQYQRDFLENGDDGTLWTTEQPNGKGATVSEGELKSRAAFFKPTQAWQLKSKPESDTGKLGHCDANEELERDEWMRKNWWKSPDVKADYEKHGAAAPLLKAGSREAIDLGVHTEPTFQASPEEIQERIAYFEEAGDTEWWKSPAVVQNFVDYGNEGAVWQARTLKESQMSMGKEFPDEKAELSERQQWFENNFWKTPESIEDFQAHGNKGRVWKRKAKGDDSEASADELAKREKWLEKHSLVDPAEVARRKEWLARQLTDEEKVFRRGWLSKQSEETKKIYADELGDVLAALNDGQQPTEEQLKAIEECVSRRRKELGIEDVKGEDAHITQEEFVAAVADTNFYVPATDEEKKRAEQEAFEAMMAEENARLEEEAAYLAMEAEEERAAAGDDYVDEGAADDEEAAFLDDMEEDNHEHTNEDDLELTAEAESEWADYLAKQGHEDEITPEEEARLAAEEEERLAAEAAVAEAEAEVWQSEELAGDDDGEEGEELAPELEDAKEQMGDLMDDEGVESFDDEEEEIEEEEEEEELLSEEKGQPLQWKLPLPEVTNPQYLKSYFTVIKYTPGHSLLGGKQKRVWVVDHFTKCFYNLDKSGKIKKEHAANKLLQLERNVADTLRLRLMFFDASHSYELQFYSPQERERFYETASAIRPSIRVYAPDLTNQDQSVEACTTTIDGVAANTVTVTCANAAGKQVTRELTGECKVNASKLLTEPLTIWTGTFNLSGHNPPRNSAQLQEWMPKDKYDIYAVGVQEASYRREENDWFEYLQHYLGKDYLTLASMSVWDTLLIVFSRKKHLLKITNVEGSTKSTVHKSVCGTKGGIGISLRYLETSVCFVTCHLAARLERNAMRNTNLEEIVDGLQLAIRETDFCNQFNHVFWFGDFNYRIELDGKQSEKLLAEKNYAELLNYDQLTMQRNNEGILHGFQEPPITFPPTYRMQVGTDKYMAEKGNSSSYCSRVLTRSMANTWVKCTGYRACKSVMVSEHQPVNATFIIRCVRPTMSCFMKQQQPIPNFVFEDVKLIESTCPVMKKPQLLFNTGFTRGFKPIDAASGQTASPVWANDKLPKLTSVTQAQEYLETSHIIMILREGAEKREDKAHRGTCHLTLFSRVIGMQDMAQDFDAEVICHGRLVGKLVGKMRWEAAPVAQ